MKPTTYSKAYKAAEARAKETKRTWWVYDVLPMEDACLITDSWKIAKGRWLYVAEPV